MAKVRVRMIAETIITIETDLVENTDQYGEIEAYLRGKSLNDAEPNEIGVAMVWSDLDVAEVDLDEFDWKVIGVSSANI